jgi:hypothetical protein
MTVIDISKDYLEMLLAKKDIEKMLIDNEEITEELDMTEFIKYLNLGSHIYCIDKNKIYPYSIVKTPTNEYMFIVNNATTKLDYTPLFDKLNSINYDYNNLTYVDNYDIMLKDLIETPHFIINERLYYDLRES